MALLRELTACNVQDEHHVADSIVGSQWRVVATAPGHHGVPADRVLVRYKQAGVGWLSAQMQLGGLLMQQTQDHQGRPVMQVT